jgi:xylulokinase
VLRHQAPPASAVLNGYRSAYRTPLPGWYAMAAMQNAGVALEWARGILGLSWEDAYAQAFSASVGETEVLFLPYLTGERSPWMNPAVRGGWVGLAPVDSPASLMRAAFRGVAYGLRAGLDALIEGGIGIDLLKLAGGGSVHPAWRQLLADTLGRPLAVLQQANASARGAALLGGIAAAHWRDTDIAALALATEAVFEPQPHAAAAATLEYQRFLALYRRLADGP